jgi:hypothetical protein
MSMALPVVFHQPAAGALLDQLALFRDVRRLGFHSWRLGAEVEGRPRSTCIVHGICGLAAIGHRKATHQCTRSAASPHPAGEHASDGCILPPSNEQTPVGLAKPDPLFLKTLPTACTLVRAFHKGIGDDASRPWSRGTVDGLSKHNCRTLTTGNRDSDWRITRNNH